MRTSTWFLLLGVGCSNATQTKPESQPARPAPMPQPARPLATGAAAPGASAVPTARATPTPAAGEATPQPRPADVPAPRAVEQPWMSLADWRARHERQLRAPGRAAAKLVFLGDSITEAWSEADAFRRHFDRYSPLNLGIGGDQTQHVLWRIEQGTLDGLKPRLLVLLIGVNNLGNGYSPSETVAGIRALLAAVKKRLPRARILVLPILPAGPSPDDPLRHKITLVNQELDALREPGQVTVHDVGSALTEPDGTIAPATMADALHPTAAGYARLTTAVAPIVEQLLAK